MLRGDHKESDDLSQNYDDINHLGSDKNHKRPMITCSDARIEPRAMVIVSFDASVTSITVVAARDSDDLAVKTKLMNWESIQELSLCH